MASKPTQPIRKSHTDTLMWNQKTEKKKKKKTYLKDSEIFVGAKHLKRKRIVKV